VNNCTRSQAVARKSRPYRLRPKPRVRLPITERKRFLRGDTVPCTLCQRNAALESHNQH